MSYGGISYFVHSFSQEYEYATKSSKVSESIPLMVDVHLVISSITLRRITLKGLNKLSANQNMALILHYSIWSW